MISSISTIDWSWCLCTALLLALAAAVFAHRRLSVSGRSVLVTGCDRGLGRSVALELARGGGMTVFAGCRTAEGVASLEADGVRALLLDVRDAAQLDAAYALVAAASPHGLHALVSNAAVFESFVCELTPIDAYRRAMEVNFFGAVRVIQRFAPLLRRAPGSRLVVVGSFLGRSSAWSLSAYAASKHALEALTVSLRAELAPFGVQVSMVRPSCMNTAMLHDVEPGVRALFAASPEAVRRAYGLQYLESLARWKWLLGVMAASPEPVVKAIGHAITARRAYAHYNVGTEALLVAYVWPLIELFVPVEISDGFISLLGDLPRPQAIIEREQEEARHSSSMLNQHERVD